MDEPVMYTMVAVPTRRGRTGLIFLVLLISGTALWAFLQVAMYQEENKALSTNLDEAQVQVAALKAENESLRANVTHMSTQVNSLKAEVDVYQSQLQAYQKTINQAATNTANQASLIPVRDLSDKIASALQPGFLDSLLKSSEPESGIKQIIVWGIVGELIFIVVLSGLLFRQEWKRYRQTL
jgi:chromosome segregation ATPase